MSDLWKGRNGSVVGYILCIVLGIVICIWPGTILLTLCRIAGLIILIFGIYRLLTCLTGRFAQGGPLVLGFVLCALGVWILSAPGSFLKLIPIVIGLVLIYHGVKECYLCAQVKRRQDRRWWIGLILGILSILFGIFLIRGAFLALEIGMIFLGIALIYVGVTGIWDNHRGGGRKQKVIDVEYTEE